MNLELKYKQTEAFGCGLYAIANLFKWDFFVTDERIEKSKKGITIGQLSKYIQEDGHNFYVDTFYYNHNLGKLPNGFEGYHIKEYPMPAMFNVKKEGGKNHIISAIINTDLSLDIMDSCKTEVFHLDSINQLNDIYDNVYGFFCFIDLDSGNYIHFL